MITSRLAQLGAHGRTARSCFRLTTCSRAGDASSLGFP